MTDAHLIANGYEPLVCAGKRPVADSWTTRPNTIEALATERQKYPYAENTGIRTGRVVGIDVDVTDAKHAAQIKAFAFETLGATSLERVGSKGMMLCYQNATPIGKISAAVEGTKNGAKVEILGKGQQFIAFGTHPDTNKPYEWVNKDEIDYLDPINVPVEKLPPVTPEALRVFAAGVAELMERQGYGSVKVTGDITESKKPKATPSQSAGKPLSLKQLRAIAAYLNPDASRDEWRDNVAGIRAAPISDDADEGQRRQVAYEYSEGKLDHLCRFKEHWPESYKSSDDVDQIFNTMPPKAGGITVGTIIKRARAAGFNGHTSIEDERSSAEAFSPYVNSQASEPSKNLFTTRADDAQLPPPRYIIDGLISENAHVVLAGASGTYKSFMAIDIGCAIAAAIQKPDILALCNHKICQPGIVFYCAAEGAHSVRTKRISAWEINQGFTPYSLENFLVASVPPLLTGENIDQLVANAKHHMVRLKRQTSLWIIDTMNRSLNGLDEDRAATASIYFNMLARLQAETGGSTLTIHHTGKDETRGLRGSSAFYAGFDTVLLIDKKETAESGSHSIVTGHVEKQKDGEENGKFYLKTQKILLPDNQISIALVAANEDDTKRAAGKNVGLRRTDVGAALKARGACPGGANEWDEAIGTGGIDTKSLATQIAETRAALESRSPFQKEIDTIRTALNRGASNAFDGYVVSHKSNGRQWAISPTSHDGSDDHV